MLQDDLFHYTKTSTALEEILFKQRLKLSQFQYTNDPKEFKDLIINKFTGVISTKNSWIFDNKVIPKLREIKLREWKVLCFSQHHPDIISGKISETDNPFLLGNCRSSMWAHYGSSPTRSHDGVCLKFNKKKLEMRINETFNDANKYTKFPGEVDYNNERFMNLPVINWDQFSNSNDAEILQLARKHFVDNYDDIFFLKSEDWVNEYEYRWILHSEKHDAEYISIVDILESVWVGENFPEAYYPSLELLCKKLNVEPGIIYWYNGIPGSAPIQYHEKLPK